MPRIERTHPLLTEGEREQLLRNGALSNADPVGDFDPIPVVKLFTPDGSATWVLSELDPEDPDIAFGLCDLGQGYAELGSVRISEIEAIRGGLGLPVERDLHQTFDKPLSAYAKQAAKLGRIDLDF